MYLVDQRGESSKIPEYLTKDNPGQSVLSSMYEETRPQIKREKARKKKKKSHLHAKLLSGRITHYLRSRLRKVQQNAHHVQLVTLIWRCIFTTAVVRGGYPRDGRTVKCSNNIPAETLSQTNIKTNYKPVGICLNIDHSRVPLTFVV